MAYGWPTWATFCTEANFGSRSVLPAFHHDHAFAGGAAGTPEEIVLMAADGGRQSVPRAEEIDGAGLPVVLSEDGGARADIGGQAVVHAGYRGGHVFPAELVGEELRQRTEFVIFDRAAVRDVWP